MKRIMCLVSILGLLLLAACQKTETEKSFTYSDDVKKALDDYQKSVQDLGKKVADNKAPEKLSGDKPDVKEAAKEWEMRQKDMLDAYSDLSTRFEQVKITSDKHFAEMDRITKSIVGDETLLAQEQKKNEEIRFQWEQRYKEAEVNMEKLKLALSRGNNLQKVIVLAGLREQLGIQIAELKAISQRATSLLADLEKFAVDGKNILSLGSDEKDSKL